MVHWPGSTEVCPRLLNSVKDDFVQESVPYDSCLHETAACVHKHRALSELPYKKKLGAKSSRASIPKALITRGRSAGGCKDPASPQTGLVSFTGTPQNMFTKTGP